jgi:hypothetical protein
LSDYIRSHSNTKPHLVHVQALDKQHVSKPGIDAQIFIPDVPGI